MLAQIKVILLAAIVLLGAYIYIQHLRLEEAKNSIENLKAQQKIDNEKHKIKMLEKDFDTINKTERAKSAKILNSDIGRHSIIIN